MKTLGQIAYDAAGDSIGSYPGAAGEWQHLPEYGKKYWEIAASAIVEECAKVAEAHADELMVIHNSGGYWDCKRVAGLIRSLSSTAVDTETR